MKAILSRPDLNHNRKTEVDRNGNQRRRPSIDLIMICRRCGQCCFHLDILVVNPRSILPDGTINSDDPEAMIFKPARQRCPHLVIEGDSTTSTATCTIHHLPCYQGTPCDQFEQIGPADAVCIMSGYFRLQICSP